MKILDIIATAVFISIGISLIGNHSYTGNTESIFEIVFFFVGIPYLAIRLPKILNDE